MNTRAILSARSIQTRQEKFFCLFWSSLDLLVVDGVLSKRDHSRFCRWILSCYCLKPETQTMLPCFISWELFASWCCTERRLYHHWFVAGYCNSLYYGMSNTNFQRLQTAECLEQSSLIVRTADVSLVFDRSSRLMCSQDICSQSTVRTSDSLDRSFVRYINSLLTKTRYPCALFQFLIQVWWFGFLPLMVWDKYLTLAGTY